MPYHDISNKPIEEDYYRDKNGNIYHIKPNDDSLIVEGKSGGHIRIRDCERFCRSLIKVDDPNEISDFIQSQKNQQNKREPQRFFIGN